MLLKAALCYSASMIEAFMYFPMGNFSIFANSYCLLDTNNFFETRKFVHRIFLIWKGIIYLRVAIKCTLENK